MTNNETKTIVVRISTGTAKGFREGFTLGAQLRAAVMDGITEKLAKENMSNEMLSMKSGWLAGPCLFLNATQNVADKIADIPHVKYVDVYEHRLAPKL